MPPKSFESNSAKTVAEESIANQDTAPLEQEPTEYYAKQIFKLKQEIKEAGTEIEILSEMARHFYNNQKPSPEIIAEFVQRFSVLKRFQSGKIDATKYVERLTKDAEDENGDSPFDTQINILSDYRNDWENDILALEEERRS